jgi:hypothetical protein
MASLGSLSFTTAVTNLASTPVTGIGKVLGLSLLCAFTATSGGTTCKVYVQTSLDGGITWYDLKQFAFTTSSAVRNANADGLAQVASATPTTGTMADDAIAHGLVGDRLRFVVTTTGTYGAGSKVDVSYQTR